MIVSDADKWYCADGEKTFGPFSVGQLLSLHSAGTIHDATLLCKFGEQEWKPFSENHDAFGTPSKIEPPVLPHQSSSGNSSADSYFKSAMDIANATVTSLGEVAAPGVKSAVGKTRAGATMAKNFSGKVVGDISHLRVQLLMPLAEIRSLSWLKNKTILGMVIVGLWPLICIQLIGSNLLATYWAIAFYFSAIWALYFYSSFAPEQATRSKVLACFFGTGIISAPILICLYYIPPFGYLLGLADSNAFLIRLFAMFSAVAVPEEICKALVLLLILKLTKEPLQPKTMLFYGLISGLGFGIYEGVSYQTGANLQFSDNPAAYYLLNLMRLTSLPFLHAIWTGIAGYFLAFSALFPARKHGLIVVAILIPACFHALHNSLDGITRLVVDVIAVMTLLIYLSKSSEIEAGLSEKAPQGNSLG